MKSLVVAAALASFSSAALAQSDARGWRQEIERADNAIMPDDLASGYVTNANACAPDLARAVWGRGQRLLGYACYHPPGHY